MRDNVQDIVFTVKEKILVAPIGSVTIFSFAVESRDCTQGHNNAVSVFLCKDSGI